ERLEHERRLEAAAVEKELPARHLEGQSAVEPLEAVGARLDDDAGEPRRDQRILDRRAAGVTARDHDAADGQLAQHLLEMPDRAEPWAERTGFAALAGA